MAYYKKPRTRVDRERSALERAVAEVYRDQWASCFQSPDADVFSEVLQSIASQATRTRQGFRDGPVFTSPDAEGVRVVFPRPGTVTTRLAALHRYLAEDAAPPVVRAMVALVALTNCHPFWDGNGRTARIVANLILNELTGCGGALRYLPLYELGNRPPGNLTLYKRSAEVLGEWSALLEFLGSMLEAAGKTHFQDVSGTGQDPTD